jgi:hypothetical protein
MSNLNAIGLILVTLIAGSFFLTYASNTINKRADMIIVGVVEGVPVSTKHRYLMLYHIYLSQLGGVIAVSIVIAVGCLQIADSVTNSDVTMLAYLVAGLGAFAAVYGLVLGTSYFIYCLQLLRETKRE